MLDSQTDNIRIKFEEICKSYKRENQYFDILFDSSSETRIIKTKTSETVSVNTERSGIVARTFIGKWKEFASQEFEDLKQFERKIPKVANRGEDIIEMDEWVFDKEIKPEIDPRGIPIEQKLDKVREIYDSIKNFDERIINPTIFYADSNLVRIFANNEGTLLSQVIPRSKLFIKPIVKEGSTIDFDYFSTGGEIGFEIFNQINEKIDTICKNSLMMINAKTPPSGNYPIILDPDMAGLIAHESFGHGLEADQVLRERSYLKPYLNKRVASDICVICDHPYIQNQMGSFFFDDEGIKSQKNILVENGILKNFLYDRRSATLLKSEPKGNGRRESFAHPLFVRMTNTYFEPGEFELEELYTGINEGVVLERGYFGMEDPLGGGMQCTSKKGYLIKNGEKTDLLKAITLSGSVLELLQNIDAISNTKLELRPGTCGKGEEDFVPVTSGGSYVRVKKALVSPG